MADRNKSISQFLAQETLIILKFLGEICLLALPDAHETIPLIVSVCMIVASTDIAHLKQFQNMHVPWTVTDLIQWQSNVTNSTLGDA